jgi:2-methylisocitrate lyase-like PEP mutase family enzyme
LPKRQTMDHHQIFTELHLQSEPFLLGNVWDVPIAKSLEKTGYQAIGTSSAAMANLLGYEDGEEMPFEEMLHLVKRIKQNISIPLSVDIEGGYAKDPSKVFENVLRLVELDIIGINIEDSVVQDNIRVLSDKEHLASKIATISARLQSIEKKLFINARIDTYLLDVPKKLNETLSRIQLYEQAGASGIFIPLLASSADIAEIVKSTRLPLNLMAIPGLPSFDQLRKLGVKRVSTGNFLHQKMNNELNLLASNILRSKEFETLFQW